MTAKSVEYVVGVQCTQRINYVSRVEMLLHSIIYIIFVFLFIFHYYCCYNFCLRAMWINGKKSRREKDLQFEQADCMVGRFLYLYTYGSAQCQKVQCQWTDPIAVTSWNASTVGNKSLDSPCYYLPQLTCQAFICRANFQSYWISLFRNRRYIFSWNPISDKWTQRSTANINLFSFVFFLLFFRFFFRSID